MGSFVEDSFWNLWIFVVTVGSILGIFFFVMLQTRHRPKSEDEVETTGHIWDDDLAELNNPMPSWWLNLFYITLAWGFVYLMLYPGLGNNDMLLDWTQIRAYDQEMQAASEQYGPLYARFLDQRLSTVAKDPDALGMGRRLFVNYCAQCHGSDGGGNRGFPSLRDHDWQWGSDPETIKTSITKGRNGIMPPWGAVLGEEGVHNVTQYVLELSANEHDPAAAAAGKSQYEQVCVACHGVDGVGNQQLGAPRINDEIWLYGGSAATIAQGITKGRQGQMPSFGSILDAAKIHVLTAYVISLSQVESEAQPQASNN